MTDTDSDTRAIPMTTRQAKMLDELDATIQEMSNRRAIVLLTIINGATDEDVQMVGYDTAAKTVTVTSHTPIHADSA